MSSYNKPEVYKINVNDPVMELELIKLTKPASPATKAIPPAIIYLLESLFGGGGGVLDVELLDDCGGHSNFFAGSNFNAFCCTFDFVF